jgi:hypothetical protein
MPVAQSLAGVMADPRPESLWRLRADVLDAGAPPGHPALEVIDAFHQYLNHLGAGGKARDLSHLASKLDVLAVGTVALENVLGHAGSEDLLRRVALAAVSEGLMVLASRQYVRAAEVEMAAVHQDLAWYLYEAYWRLSEERRPDLDPETRRQGVEHTVAPLRLPEIESTSRVVLIALLLELLLLVRLEPWLKPPPGDGDPVG